MLWVHGGGYVMGTAAQDDRICRRFADRLDIVVAAVDYRLAPDHPFPVPLHDCYDALTWLTHQPEVDPTRVAVGGASAGGGLAAALTLLARERSQVDLCFQLLAYPMLDDRTTLRRDIDERTLRLWSIKANRFGWQSYLGRAPGSTEVSPLAAPSRAAMICVDCRRPGSAWARVICSAKRTSPTPADSEPPAWRATWTW